MQKAEQHACDAPGVKLVRNSLTPDEPLSMPEQDQPGGAAPKMGKPGYER